MNRLTLVVAMLASGIIYGVARDEAPLPPDSRLALDALNQSPRHGEWVSVEASELDAPLRTWVVFPERSDKAPAVVLIHGIYGLSDWVRAAADRLAAAGFIAVAPDLLSGNGPDGAGYESLESRDDVVKAMQALTPELVMWQIDAVRNYGIGLPAASGRSATVGFCWGGGQSFTYATTQPKLDAAVVFYGSSATSGSLSAIHAPVLGLYGGDDQRVNAMIPDARTEMARLDKTYEVEIYEGAGHAFLSRQSERGGANLRATQQAWPRAVTFLRDHTEN